MLYQFFTLNILHFYFLGCLSIHMYIHGGCTSDFDIAYRCCCWCILVKASNHTCTSVIFHNFQCFPNLLLNHSNLSFGFSGLRCLGEWYLGWFGIQVISHQSQCTFSLTLSFLILTSPMVLLQDLVGFKIRSFCVVIEQISHLVGCSILPVLMIVMIPL